MISPTGKGIRSDRYGSGEYGAARGTRRHNGVDYLCDVGQDIVAPFDMIIVRVAKANIHSKTSGIKWQRGKSTGIMLYFEPDQDLIGEPVKEGDVIGKAQDVSKDYGLPGMKAHIHFSIN